MSFMTDSYFVPNNADVQTILATAHGPSIVDHVLSLRRASKLAEKPGPSGDLVGGAKTTKWDHGGELCAFALLSFLHNQ